MNRRSILIGGIIAAVGLFVALSIVFGVTVVRRREHQEAASAAASAEHLATLRAMTREQRKTLAIQEGRSGDESVDEITTLISASSGADEAAELKGLFAANRVASLCKKAMDGDDSRELTTAMAVLLKFARVEDIRSLGMTTIGEARKDSVANRGKCIEASGTIVQIMKDGDVFRGLLVTDDAKPISFATAVSTDGIVEDSRATFIGLFKQQYSFKNVSGGETQSLLLVGLFTSQPQPKKATKEQEKERFEAVKAKLRANRPKTEKEIKAILGEPSNTMQDFMGQGDLVQWYFETHDVGRDVIQCVVHKDGSISMLSY